MQTLKTSYEKGTFPLIEQAKHYTMETLQHVVLLLFLGTVKRYILNSSQPLPQNSLWYSSKQDSDREPSFQ